MNRVINRLKCTSQSHPCFCMQVLKHDEVPSLDTWLDCTCELCPVTVHTTGVIEDAGHNSIEVCVVSLLAANSDDS